jgi:hypothetical protein
MPWKLQPGAERIPKANLESLDRMSYATKEELFCTNEVSMLGL